jgi:DNA-binding response OmpR family regulator
MPYIIAVDDDPEVLGTLGRVLEYEDFEVTLASSGPEALTAMNKRKPDLVILDIIMPEMDGITICRQLRHDPRFASLPVLFLTAKGSTDDVVQGLDAGAVLQLGDLILDSDTYQVTVDDESIQLTSTEHRLLRYLMEHVNQALSLNHLLQAVWEYPPDTGDPDLVRAHVRNLRAKIEKDADHRYIRTIHGVGYMISN